MSKYGLELIRQLQPVSWKYCAEACFQNGVSEISDFERTHFGVIAQDLAELLPSDSFAAVSCDEKGNLMVNYIQLIGPMISAIQELASEVGRLKEKLNDKSN